MATLPSVEQFCPYCHKAKHPDAERCPAIGGTRSAPLNQHQADNEEEAAIVRHNRQRQKEKPK